MKQVIISNGNSVVAVENNTARRAVVIASRIKDNALAVMKAQLIELLKEKLHSGVAHFVYMKKDGSLREAWGTCSGNLMKANINGTGISRDSVNTVCYWDVEKGAFRSFRFENLVQVF